MITLSVNKFIGTLTNLIAYQDVNNTLKEGNINPLLNMVMHENVPNGNGKVVYTVNTLPVSDYEEQSTLLTVEKPEIHEQYIRVENFKKIKLSLNEWLMRGAFIREDAMAKLTAYLREAMYKTKQYYLYSVALLNVENLLETTPQTNYDFTAPTGTAVEKRAMKEENANELFGAIQNELTQFTFPRRHTIGDKKFMQAYDPSDFRILLPYDVNTKLNINSLARLFNNAYALKGISSENIIIMPSWNDAGEIGYDPNEQVATPALSGVDLQFLPDDSAVIIHKDKIQMGYFYEIATAFFDASNLTNHSWLHFSYYTGVIDAYPVVKLTPRS